ncbi:MAG: ABC transporter substrate-binding protein [Acetobacteraceae bacterium]|nr:ABC transporter substrate-binding protein [Acetobacteraceae bacterium]
MKISRRSLIATSAAASVLPALRARAQNQNQTIKLGVLTDLSGPYSDVGGKVSTACAQLAADDFGASGKGINVQVIQADHQNKPDVGTSIARQWFDNQGVDVILDVPNSGVGLAVAGIAKEKNKVYINTGSATSDLTGPNCTPNTVHWGYDTYMLAKSTGGSIVKSGGTSWYFVTANYTFGQILERQTTEFIKAAGGKVLGSNTYPFPGTTDFSSQLVAAQSSGAKVLGLASAGADTINQVKQAHEFGLQMTIAGLLVFISDVHAMSLEDAQGLRVTSSFYWDLNDRTRAFSKRLEPKAPNVRATMVQAGVYAGALHYLKAATEMGVAQAKKDGAATVAQMKKMPFDDDCFGTGKIREDGVALVNAYLFEVKKPSESKGPWDYYRQIAMTPADQAFMPLNQTQCSLVKA